MARLGDGWTQRWEGLARTTAALAARLDAFEARRCWRMPLQAPVTMLPNSCHWLAHASMSPSADLPSRLCSVQCS